MSSLTRLQVRDYVRAKLGELDSQKIETGILNADINFAQRKVQADLIPLVGMKLFTKEAELIGSTPAEPSDLLPQPDSIIKIQSGVANGTRAKYTVNYTVPTVSIVYTAKDFGTAGNSIRLQLDANTVTGVVVSVAYTTFYTITVDFEIGVSTCQNIIDAINNHTLAKTLVVATTTSPTETPSPRVGTNVLLSGGTDGSPTLYPCREMTIEEYIEIPNNTYLAPSTTAPQFVRRGDASGNKTIEFLPNTINYSKIFYRYSIADLSSDASTLTIPIDYQELVLMKVIQMSYETLKANAESQAKQLEYANKVKEFETSYIAGRNSILAEKTRLQSNDQTN